MELPIYQVDAFADRLFTGNPAAIVPLDRWLDDATLQAIAAENNLAETAYFIPEGDRFHLRWFTPGTEVDLCGHATLASGAVLWEQLGYSGEELRFQTLSGELIVRRKDGRYALDFPSRPPQRVPVSEDLIPALGTQPATVLGARDYLVVYASEDEVRGLQPSMQQLCLIDRFAVIATAPAKPGSSYDFVSRFFAPAKGVPEDPVRQDHAAPAA